ncbi:hypothetical protein TRIATDRAFT_88432 [Trichoderma atroviride IMI 206040]|uniref:BZIP domain-containing protein n=1 Tax=Hypocrea atroviridis (strain ATCC 20476 / IMI 206040) TaxID=452589 RepID=G9NWS5_HYPAI|nr:uncharacterized protein TRIATDRAFT_88432 [Trichoderma atroviride IMI 206040]EHK44633.1 hypothetical protein TRIATDRAFT_88432 [Trichoderma atroviride IMI 206040]
MNLEFPMSFAKAYLLIYPEREENCLAIEDKSGDKKSAIQKREARFKNASPAARTRRRAQNRVSQRIYRERKAKRIQELEQSLIDARVWWQSNYVDMYAFVGQPRGEAMIFTAPEAAGGEQSTDTSAVGWTFDGGAST